MNNIIQTIFVAKSASREHFKKLYLDYEATVTLCNNTRFQLDRFGNNTYRNPAHPDVFFESQSAVILACRDYVEPQFPYQKIDTVIRIEYNIHNDRDVLKIGMGNTFLCIHKEQEEWYRLSVDGELEDLIDERFMSLYGIIKPYLSLLNYMLNHFPVDENATKKTQSCEISLLKLDDILKEWNSTWNLSGDAIKMFFVTDFLSFLKGEIDKNSYNISEEDLHI